MTVATGTPITLDGSGSDDPDNHTPLTYTWTQTSGPAVSLYYPNSATPNLTTPNSPTVLTFQLTVTDACRLADPTPDVVVVTVKAYTYLPIVLRQ